MIKHIQSLGRVWTVYSSIFKDIWGYWCICSYTHRHTTRAERGASPGLFENQKKCPDFGKNGLDCVHFWIKFSIQNAVLRVWEKFPNCFPMGPFLLLFLTRFLWKWPSSTKPSKTYVAFALNNIGLNIRKHFFIHTNA